VQHFPIGMFTSRDGLHMNDFVAVSRNGELVPAGAAERRR
jgi:hypothetical protein